MLFQTKLQLLMKTLKISNKELAMEMGVDASLISRWRTGGRKLSASSHYIHDIASCLVKNARLNAQRLAILQLTGTTLDLVNASDAELASIVANWLVSENNGDEYTGEVIRSFLRRVDTNSFSFNNKLLNLSDAEIWQSKTNGGEIRQVEVFRGEEGMQHAVLKVLKDLLNSTQSKNVIAYSDQSLNWLINDPDFLRQWASMMDQCVRKGHTLQIIHTVKREVDELFAIIEKWLPYYVTDKVRPYYCPKYSETMFKRTLIAVPELCSVTSNTLTGQEKNGEYEYSTNAQKIKSTLEMLQNILINSIPLIQYYVPRDSSSYLEYLDYHNAQPGDSIALLYTITSLTMPESVFERNIQRFGFNEKKHQELMALFRRNTEQFRKNLLVNNYTEVVALPPPEQFDFKRIPVDTVPYLASHPMFFERKEDFVEHLENTISTIEKYDNYHFYLYKKPYLNNIQILAKNEVGVVFTKRDWTFLTFVLKQENMIGAFMNYLHNTLKSIPSQDKEKSSVIRQLRQYI